jgi:hypothetical protein
LHGQAPSNQGGVPGGMYSKLCQGFLKLLEGDASFHPRPLQLWRFVDALAH